MTSLLIWLLEALLFSVFWIDMFVFRSVFMSWFEVEMVAIIGELLMIAS